MTSIPPEKTREFHKEENGEELTSLLVECSVELSSLCDGIEIHRAKKRMRRFFFFSIALCATAASYIYVTVFEQRLIFLYCVSVFSLFMAAYALLALLATNRLLLDFLLPIDLKEKKFSREAKLLSARLEKVIRIVSQIQDHSPKHISRLTDAELVLERSLLYLKQR
jgi:hypothetical protein